MNIDIDKVKLNDFDSFNRVIFPDKDPTTITDEDWKGAFQVAKIPDIAAYIYDYVKLPYDLPAATDPIEYFQFHHYLYWMLICANRMTNKPDVYTVHGNCVITPVSACYACHYTCCNTRKSSRRLMALPIGCSICPIKIFDVSYACETMENSLYNGWCRETARKNETYSSEYARQIAHLEWGIPEDLSK